jgi:hypothetical protein
MNEIRLPNDSLLLAPKESHPFFEDYFSKHPVKGLTILSLEELEGRFRYQYGEDTLKFVKSLLHGKKTLANLGVQDFVFALSYLTKGDYRSKRLQTLAHFVERLVTQGLFKKLEHPENVLINHPIFLYGYSDVTRFSDLIDPYPRMTVSFLPPLEEEADNKAYLYEDEEKEAAGLINAIAGDLKSGFPAEKIHVLGVNRHTSPLLKELAKVKGIKASFTKKPLQGAADFAYSSYYVKPGEHFYLFDLTEGNYPRYKKLDTYFDEEEKKEIGYPSLASLFRSATSQLVSFLKQKEVRFISVHEGASFDEALLQSGLPLEPIL